MTAQVATGGAPFKRRTPLRKPVGGSIEQTLSSLGISNDVAPESAVAEAQEQLEREPGNPIEDLNGHTPAKRPAARAGARRTAAPSMPPAAKPAQAKTVASTVDVVEVPIVEDIPDVEEGGGEPAQLSAAPTPIKGRAVKPSPALSKLGTEIASRMPGAEIIRVQKRLDSGQLAHVHDYSKQDIAGQADFEAFLAKYVKPKYGPGEYKITGRDSKGLVYEAGSIFLIDPPAQSEQNSALGIIQNVLAQQQKNHEEQLKKMEASVSAQPNPVSVLREIHSFQKEIAPPPPPAPASQDGTLAAVISASAQSQAQMMQLLMQQMQAAQLAAQQQTTLMIQQMQESSNRNMQLMLEVMKSKETSSSSSSMPMPPPPAPENPLSGVKEILSMLGDMGVFGGGAPADDTFKQIFLQNQLSVKDILELTKGREGGGGGGIKEAFENMAVVMNMANQLRQNTEGSPQATVWDAIAALVSNKDFAGSIASAIRVNTEQVQRQAQMTQHQQLLVQQRSLRLAEQQRAAAAQQVAVATPPAQARPSAPPAAPTQQQAQAAAERLRAHGFTPPSSLPPGIEEKISDLAEAVNKKEDAGIVQEAITLALFMHGFDEWKPFAQKLLGAAQAGEKEQTLQILGGLLGGFVQMQLMTVEVGREVMRCIDAHFGVIHAKLTGQEPPPPEPVKTESVLPPGIEPVFNVPSPEEIDETGNPLDEGEDDEGEDDEDEEDGDGGDEE